MRANDESIPYARTPTTRIDAVRQTQCNGGGATERTGRRSRQDISSTSPMIEWFPRTAETAIRTRRSTDPQAAQHNNGERGPH